MSNPRSLFYGNPDLAKWHKSLVNSDTFDVAVTYAMAQLVTERPTADQMIGAQSFVRVFRELSTKLEEPTRFEAPRLVPPELLGRPKPPESQQPHHD